MHQDDGVYNMSHMSALNTYPQGLLQASLDNTNATPPPIPPHPSRTQYPAVLTPSPLFKDQTSISAQAVSDDLITLASPLRIQLLLTVHQQFTIYSPSSAVCETAVWAIAKLR
ncbi:hypothetical protein QQF64_007004 [Cirrhinus molitorella]|uniref:Uncharacterized protein n=1 Tax=Cirrhinus molitorella TaxID=172907 RepID=A0ABR3M9H4_9TELE